MERLGTFGGGIQQPMGVSDGHTRGYAPTVDVFFFRNSKSKAQAEVADAVARREPVAERDATIPGVVAPTATTVDAVGARGVIQVLTPFPHIATHVIDTQLVRRFHLYWVSFITAIIHIPSYIAQGVASTILISPALISSLGRILPLGLLRQTEVLSCEGVQTADEFLAVIPVHPLHRTVISSEVRGIAAHHRLPQSLRHLGLTNIERGAQPFY